jgi:hypothetical protein
VNLKSIRSLRTMTEIPSTKTAMTKDTVLLCQDEGLARPKLCLRFFEQVGCERCPMELGLSRVLSVGRVFTGSME